MITSSFDTSKPIVSPQSFYKKGNNLCDICLITFSKKILKYVKDNYSCQEVKYSAEDSVYIFESFNKKIGIYLSKVGAPASAMDLLNVQFLVGATKFIAFGSAGSLNESATKGKYIIPTQAYRDEGLSYHYAEASDYIQIKNSEKLSVLLKKLNVPFCTGKIWTTDAVYMETEAKFNQRKNDGCLAVDMETSGLQAVCNFYNFEFFCFLETGDVLSNAEYSKGNLSKANHGLDKLFLAIEVAKEISC